MTSVPGHRESVVRFIPGDVGRETVPSGHGGAAGRSAPLPTEAIVSVTNRCDARCTMCNIWQLERQELMSAEDYRRALPGSLRNVNITGGEALLRPDIVEVVQAIHEAAGRPRVVLATNGFRTDRTLRTIADIRRFVPGLGIAVSLDGGPAVHDAMRGVPNAHRRAVETLRALRRSGVEDMRIGFTATPENIHELIDVYELSRELGVEFTATVAQNSEIYYATTSNAEVGAEAVGSAFGELIRRRMRSTSVKDWLRAYFDNGVIEFARTGRRSTQCEAGSAFFFLTPTGDVYPCLTLPEPLGNLRTSDFDLIWNSDRARRVRRIVDGCDKCWMMCTARTTLRQRPMRVAAWVAGAHARARFG